MNTLERLERANPVADADRLLSASGAMDDFVLAVKQRSEIVQTTEDQAPIEVPETQVQEIDPNRPIFKKDRRRGLVYGLAAALVVLMLGSVVWAVFLNDSEPDVAGGLAAGTARITIGDTTWEAVADIQCLDFGSALGFKGHAVDDPTITIDISANTGRPSSNSSQVHTDDDIDWHAGEGDVRFGATIPVVTADSGYGTGTATFVNIGAGGVAGETAEGSYEFFCG